MKNLDIHLQTLSLKDEAILEDFLALKYRATKEELLLEGENMLKDPDLLKILNRSYYAKAQKYFNENLFNYAREENNTSNSKIIAEKYEAYLNRTKRTIVESLENPYNQEAFNTSLEQVFEGIDFSKSPEIQAIKEDIAALYEEEYMSFDPSLIQLFNETYKELEDGGMPQFLAATQNLPDEAKEQMFQMAMNKMPMDDKLNMAVNYLDMSDVQDIGPEVSDMADTIRQSRIDQGDSAKAIASLIGQITDNPKEAQSILGSLSDDTLHLLSNYLDGMGPLSPNETENHSAMSQSGIESEYPNNTDTQRAFRLEEGETEAYSNTKSFDDSSPEREEPEISPSLEDPYDSEEDDNQYALDDSAPADSAPVDDNDDADNTSAFQDEPSQYEDSDSDFEH